MKKFIEYFTDEHIALLRNQLLFSGLNDHEIFMFIQYSQPYYSNIKYGKSISIAGKYSHMTGAVISGRAHLYTVDYEGNKTLLKSIGSEDSGTIYSMFDYYNSVLELTATEDSELILIPPEKIFIAEEKLAMIQQKIVVNMIASQRQVYLELSEHLSCLTQRNIRDKILKFLKNRCEQEHSLSFSVPFSREELANYLAVDRASLSRSLSELKSNGILDFRKNKFTILKTNIFKYE